jgi:cysteine desulfurase
MSAPIYLDYQATTPLEPEVLKAMMPYLEGRFGNPHSASHRYGWEGKAAVDVARAQIAALIGAEADDLIFTCGATEANNLALRGLLEAAPPGRNRIVTLITEHACVLETARDLERRGCTLTVLQVQPDGLLSLDALKATMGPDVALVSVMLVNNEIGVIQPLADIAAIAHASGALVHSDAAQAAGKIPVDVDALGVDLLSLTAHKLYGPKGVGALWRRPGLTLRPQMTGGGQEGDGLRSGTLSPFLCAGFGKACVMAAEQLAADDAHVSALSEALLARLRGSNIAFRINGSTTARYRGNLSLGFPDCDSARLMADLRGLALSSGSACSSGTARPSRVLAALGVPPDTHGATLRIGLGRPTSLDDIALAAAKIIAAVRAQQEQA